MNGPAREMLASSPFGAGVTLVLVAIAALLTVGTVERGIRARWRPGDVVLKERLRSLAGWWVLFGVFVGALALGPGAVTVTMCGLSLLLLRDTLRLAGGMGWYPLAAAGALAAFTVVWRGGDAILIWGFPVFAAILLGAEWTYRRASRPHSREPLGPACVIGLAGPLYAAGVARLPVATDWMDDPLGWFILLFVLTELNDSAQAWWGRSIGTHPLTPTLSPNKTWEGLVGGVLTMSGVALLVAPLLTPFGRAAPAPGTTSPAPWVWCAGFAVLLGLGGVAGDLLGSWLKRRAGVKDSGRLIPGQGGMLDRLDSLTVTAPFFYLVSRLLWFG